MSKDLISRKALVDAIKTDFYEHFTMYPDSEQTELIDFVMDTIEEMPTAYDVDKVCKELEDATGCIHYTEDASFDGKFIEDFEFIQSKTAIEIVRNGGMKK